MRAFFIALAFVLSGALNPVAASEDLAPVGSPDRVTIYRGGQYDHPSPIAVYRGSAAPPGYLATTALSAGSEIGPVGGRQIWFVDPAQDRLTNCRAWNTTMIGQRRILCTPSRRLPD
ncbi:MAG: hypothetical protein AB7I59_25525 [Geminicoccaceae bacterium]